MIANTPMRVSASASFGRSNLQPEDGVAVVGERGSGGAPATPYAGSLCTDGRVDASLLGVAAVLRAPSPAPWHATAHWQRDVLRTLGNARDFAGARRVFEGAPRPRRMVVWEEMIRVCNLCGEPGFASQVLAEKAQGQGGGGKMAPGFSFTPPPK